MSSMVAGRVNVALATVVFLIVAGGFVGTLYWMGSTVNSSHGNFLMAQATSSPAPDKADKDQAQPSDSVSKENGKKEKPPIGICQETWISGWNVPTYKCSILFGPV